MATSLPWSVKGVDPRTRDAAKAAARRAGMTLGEWLDNKIRDEAADDSDAPPPEQLDIAALSERLARLSQTQMDTAAGAPRNPAPSRHDIDSVINQAAAAERLTRESTAKTAGALDSIARWIEKTESRMSAGERAAAERQERATSVIADAIKSMGERIVDIERKTVDAQRRPAEAQAPRLAFSRDGLAAAVSDIRERQRSLDDDRSAPAPAPAPAPAARTVPESRIAALREDLRALSSRISPAESLQAPMPAAAFEGRAAANPIESMIADLGSRLDRLDRRDGFDPILKPLARIESEVSRLSQDRSGDSYQRFELEIAHLAAKVDALATRDGDRSLLTPMQRDVAELREMMAASGGERRIDDLSRQISTLSGEIARMRETQSDGGELRGLSHAIEDVRDAILSDRADRDRSVDPAPLLSLSRQIESLAGKIETLPAMRPEVINAQAEQLAQRLSDLDATGNGVSNALSQRIEALVIKLENLADRPQDQLEDQIDLLRQRIETLAEQGPSAVTRQIEALAGRIEHLAASSDLTQIVNEGKGVKVARVDMQPIEDMLRGLAEKIDEAGKPGAESDAFDSLEQQISGLAARLDAAAATRTAESGIERTLQDLVVHLKSLREETTEAATNAARAAVSGLADRTAPGSGIAELSTLVTGLRETHVSSGRETQDAIGAVHQTLETVISRLASLEAELASGAGMRTPMPPRAVEPARAPAMPAARPFDGPAAMSAAAEDRFAPERAEERRSEAPLAAPLDIPLEPGSGRPRLDGSPAPAQDPQSIRQNLIAAARRSAKAATEAATLAPTATAEPAPKSGGRLKEIMEKRKRPLLLGLAAIVLAMGTAHVVTGALQQDKPAAIDKGVLQNLASLEPEAALPAAPAKSHGSAQHAPTNPIGAAIVAPALAMAPATESTGSTTPSAAQTPPAAAPNEPVQAVTGVGDLPATLGSAGLRKAAFAGDARAVYELASRAVDGPAASRDPKLALRLFERAAVAGLAPAQFRLGNMFEKGIGTPRDIALARVWYTRAAERGNAKAMHNLAVLHAEGVSGKPDYATATEWFRRAAELGVRDSQYNLAILLGRGLGAPADLGQSYLWFAIAAVQGDEDAGRKREEVALRLKPDDLGAVKRAVESWKPNALDALANEVAAPAKGWDASPSAAAKTARPTRS